MSNKDILLGFYEATGNNTESLVFLKKFQAIPPEKFAVLYASPEIVSEFAESLFYDLKLLYQLELFPVLLIHIKSLEYIKLFYKNIYNRIQHISLDDLPVNLIHYKLNLKRDIVGAISQKRLPMVVTDKPIENTYPILFELIKELETNKLILLSQSGGIRFTDTEEKLSIINLRTEYEATIQNKNLSKDDKKLVTDIKNLYGNLKHQNLSIAIASPLGLLEELFTIKGGGTFIKQGSEIKVHTNAEALDRKRLSYLLQVSFHKTIHPTFFDSDISCIFLESDYKGAAIMKSSPFGDYLTKFAVDEIARGEGIGRDLWDMMKARYSSFFWRAKPKNPINKWYMKECSGMQKFSDWFVFWVNTPIEQIESICKYMCEQPPDFLEG